MWKKGGNSSVCYLFGFDSIALLSVILAVHSTGGVNIDRGVNINNLMRNNVIIQQTIPNI